MTPKKRPSPTPRRWRLRTSPAPAGAAGHDQRWHALAKPAAQGLHGIEQQGKVLVRLDGADKQDERAAADATPVQNGPIPGRVGSSLPLELSQPIGSTAIGRVGSDQSSGRLRAYCLTCNELVSQPSTCGAIPRNWSAKTLENPAGDQSGRCRT